MNKKEATSTERDSAPPLKAYLFVIAVVVAGIMIAHDGVAGVLRVGLAVVALLIGWFLIFVVRGMLRRDEPREVQPSYIDVAVAQSHTRQSAWRQHDSR